MIELKTPELIGGLMAHLLKELRDAHPSYSTMEDPTYLLGSDEIDILFENLYKHVEEAGDKEFSDHKEFSEYLETKDIDIASVVVVEDNSLFLVIFVIDKSSKQRVELRIKMKSQHKCSCQIRCTYEQFQPLARLEETTKSYLGILLLSMPIAYKDIKEGRAQINKRQPQS